MIISSIALKKSIQIMQIQQIQGLSTKSRGILYHLKIALIAHKVTFQTHICNIFQFRKQKYKKPEFHSIIRKFDEDLCLSDIDVLFDELDESKNGYVFYYSLEKALESINQSDNPNQYLNRMSKIRCKTEEDVNKYEVLIEVKDLLIGAEYYREILDEFSTEEKGYLTKQNFEQLLYNFGYDNPLKKKILIDVFFNKKDKVTISSILEQLGLNEDGMRLSLREPQNKKQELKQEESEYIQEQKKSKVRRNSVNLKKMNQTQKSFAFFVPNQTPGILSIENIPNGLKEYFNYGSELEEGFAFLANDYIENKQFFLDDQNPSFSRAAGFIHIAQVCPNYQLFNKAKSVMHRNRKGLGQILQPKDIKQGSVGDCYFLSALAALVEDYPQLVYRLFVLEKNPSHIFGVRLFIEGIWKTIILDGILPINRYGKLCAAQPHENQVWVLMLEKAWAKEFGSYDKIHSGLNEEGLVAISGAPTIVISSRQPTVLKRIEVEFTKGSVITCSTSQEVVQLTDRQQEQIGVFASHAYTILKTYINIPYRDSTITLLKVRNPWGQKGWKKDWSFSSKKWTKQLREMMDFVKDPKDGTFFISYEDFVIYFDNINISKLNLGYTHSWVTNQGSRYEFYENRLTVKDPGDYFFTVYQENPRRHRHSVNTYKKSKSYLFLAKIEKQTEYGMIKKLKTFACQASAFRDNTLQTTLEPGNYILVSNVVWNHHDAHPYNITAYGPGKVAFSEGVVSSNETIKHLVDSRAQEILGYGTAKSAFYEHYNIQKSLYCSIEQGIGFLAIRNSDQVLLETQIAFQPCNGINFLLPHFLPLKLSVLPFETVICSFLVSPEGYNYQQKERYNIQRV